MAAQLFGGRITLPATAQSITQLIAAGPTSSFTNRGISVMAVRANKTNTGITYFVSNSAGTADGATSLGFIDKGDSLTLSLWGYMKTDNIFIVGTQNDVIYVWVVEY